MLRRDEMQMGTCPVCNGSGRVALSDRDRKYAPNLYGYDKETDTVPCRNCGGQTMYGEPTGKVLLRPDGTPCVHEYVGVQRGRCYTVYTCKHCGSSYDIDSGD